MHPSELIATHINQYLELTLHSFEINSLGEWQNTLQRLLAQWESISRQYEQAPQIAVKMKINKKMPH